MVIAQVIGFNMTHVTVGFVHGTGRAVEERFDALDSFNEQCDTFSIGSEIAVEVVGLRNRHIDDVIKSIGNLVERCGLEVDGDGDNAVGFNLCARIGIGKARGSIHGVASGNKIAGEGPSNLSGNASEQDLRSCEWCSRH